MRKANPTAGDVHVDRPLTTLSVAWIQDQSRYIAARAFPIVPVAKQSDLYYIFDRADWLRATAEKRAPSTESAGGGFRISNTNYFADVWAFHKDVDDQIRANADQIIDPDKAAVQFSSQACLTRRELEWATKYFATGVWANERAGVASGASGTQFNRWDVASTTPIADIRAAKQTISRATGFTPNKLILGSDVWNALQDHAEFTDRIVAGQTPGGPAIVSKAVLAAVLELEEVMISDAVINTGPEEGTEATDFVLGKHALLCYAAPSPAIDIPSAGYTFSWTGLFGAGSAGSRIKRFRIEKISSDRVECEMAWDQKVVSTGLGAFFLDAVS
jgi:hypothetical protein